MQIVGIVMDVAQRLYGQPRLLLASSFPQCLVMKPGICACIFFMSKFSGAVKVSEATADNGIEGQFGWLYLIYLPFQTTPGI